MSGQSVGHKSAFLRDFVDVGVPVEVAQAALCSDGGWLTPIMDGASVDGDALLLRIGTTSRGPMQLRISLGECKRSDLGAVVPIRWEAARLPGLFPVLDGDLEVLPLGEDQCRISLQASYRMPLDGVGLLLNHVALHLVAESTVRSFLRRMAATLEENARR